MTDQQADQFQIPLPWQVSQWDQISRQFKNRQLAHAYLLCGESGLGKALFASKFAHRMLCLQADTYSACGECKNCFLGGAHYHPDIVTISPEQGSKDIKIEQIRLLLEFVNRTSHAGSHKVVIIEQAHRLNRSAANALLKTLEEPTGDTYLFLVSDVSGSLPLTIRSRCQRLLFSAPPLTDAAGWLAGRMEADQVQPSLMATNCRPLLALRYADDGLVENRQQFLRKLAEILQNQSSIQGVVKFASTIGELQVLGYLAATSSILIRYLLTRQRPHDADEAIELLWSIMESSNQAAKPLALGLMDFHEETQRARRQLMGSTNPNSQLMLESLLWHWSKLAQHPITGSMRHG